MRLLIEHAQSIVDETMKTLGHNINIVDTAGIIIGSGDKRRINAYHPISEQAVAKGEMVITTKEEAKDIKGVKEGVNIPITLNGKIVGAVGITGNPEQILPIAELIKVFIESQLRHAFVTEQLKIDDDTLEMFLIDFINGNTDDEENIMGKAAILGLDFHLPRIAIVVKIKSNSKVDYVSLKKQVKSCFPNPKQIIFWNRNSSFNILFTLEKEKMLNNSVMKKEVLHRINNFKALAENKKFTYNIGVGGFYPGLEGLKKSYKEAFELVDINEKLIGSKHVSFAFEKNLHLLLNRISESKTNDFKHRFGKNINNNTVLNDEKLVNALLAFFRADLSISKAAENLGINRNTLSTYLNKVYKITGYNPKSFNDAMELRTLLLLHMLGKLE